MNWKYLIIGVVFIATLFILLVLIIANIARNDTAGLDEKKASIQVEYDNLSTLQEKAKSINYTDLPSCSEIENLPKKNRTFFLYPEQISVMNGLSESNENSFLSSEMFQNMKPIKNIEYNAAANNIIRDLNTLKTSNLILIMNPKIEEATLLGGWRYNPGKITFVGVRLDENNPICKHSIEVQGRDDIVFRSIDDNVRKRILYDNLREQYSKYISESSYGNFITNY